MEANRAFLLMRSKRSRRRRIRSASSGEIATGDGDDGDGDEGETEGGGRVSGVDGGEAVNQRRQNRR